MSSHHTDTSNIVTSSDVGNISNFELGVFYDLVILEVELDGIIDLQVRVGVSKGATIMGDNIGNTVRAHLSSLDTA